MNSIKLLKFSLFKIYSQSNNANVVELVSTVMQLPSTLTWLFIYCEFGEQVTYEFNMFHEKLCHCRWYSFPIELQRMFLITLSGTEEPAVIQGFASTTCTRDAFKQVILLKNFWKF